MVVMDLANDQEYHFINTNVAMAFGSVKALQENKLNDWACNKEKHASLIRPHIIEGVTGYRCGGLLIPYNTIEPVLPAKP